MEHIESRSLVLFDFHMNNLVYKSQWIERSLPKYIGLRIDSLLSSELIHLDSVSQLSKTAAVIDIIYAFAKNARWHSSEFFLEAISSQIDVRYQFRCPKTLDLAFDLLGNSSLISAEADRCFLIHYFSVWYEYPFSESSERICGLSHDWYENLKKNQRNPHHNAALEMLGWFKALQSQQSLWQVDELKLQVVSTYNLEGNLVPGTLFSDLFKELREADPRTPLSDRFINCEKSGIVFRVEEEGQTYDLSIDGQRLTARFAVSQGQSLSLLEFLQWCEPWQRCFLQTPSSHRKFILSSLVQSEIFPKMSVFGEFIASLEEEFGDEFCRNYLIQSLENQTSNWLRAALLVAGKHLLDQDILNQTAASLLDLPSNEIQRLAADVLFA
ncbi:MAG: hypothetical protein WCI18_05355 [Pseudomonadota bacterium]